MTQAISVPARRFGELRVVAPICAAHFLSHYYMIMLAPLFAFVRAAYGVSYTDLALALTAFNVVSAVLQTPAGFLVDRIGARLVLIAGVAIGTAAFAVAGIVDSFVVFIAMYAVAGLGNTAYHPADYSLLSHHSAPARMGQVFSFHTFAGILGSAVAPATMLVMQSRFGFPRAPLIHVIRHPLDIMVSAMANHFSHGFFCGASLETAARHYVRVMELVQHYRAEMPLRYLPIRYEDIIDDQAGRVQALLDFVGVGFEATCLNFHENRRYARTASYAQVTEKLNDRSRFRYRHYLKHLEPVIEELQPVIERLGYTVA